MNRSRNRGQQAWRDFKCRVFGHAMHVKSREPGRDGDAKLFCSQCGRLFRSTPGSGVWVDRTAERPQRRQRH